ncbi:MAG: V-type ATPase subunit [Candidatus Thiodiazotropha sp. (ex. Lucinisca nassula)]|uniref:V-type ATPase subunit n=1 Tax=Candidatus Thiodiazotropha sp. LNASS1 TaxID=3096260 RepID=UPI000D3DC686|nr:V-type ATPase subunit [Candidatus Thiodiazotropha sp. (ex. Lucinisca nassula)]MBW9272790.1 V-type ATPase subunit [Candidatus Thiodiazotropha sp. (ex. Lucinisca nassula)]PUB85584.1 MAG: ATPase [gamma proteobacterium symbiont of Ctena orbiculata]PUB85616.1 MAG: ATPase [gamma proteobacterium symbiont of Ctena orbiculata]
MSSNRDQAYLKTRVGVLSARLLDADEIERLKQMSLRQLGDAFDLQPIFEESIDNRQRIRLVEQALLQRLMSELSVLLRPLSGRSRGLMLYWPRKFELYNLKTLIRGKLNSLGMEEIRDNLFEMPENIRLPHESLLQAENVLEMLRQLDQGPYALIARQARNVFEEQHENFSLDAAIDRLYYTGMLRHANITDSIDKRGLKKVIGIMVDRQNILWLLRYRLVYRFAPSEAYYLLIPYGGRLQREKLMELANLDGLETIIEHLPAPFKAILSNANSITQVRQRLDQTVSDELRKLMHHSPDAVVSALSYLIIRDMDLMKLYAIIQSKLLQMDGTILNEAVPGNPLQMDATEASHV